MRKKVATMGHHRELLFLHGEVVEDELGPIVIVPRSTTVVMDPESPYPLAKFVYVEGAPPHPIPKEEAEGECIQIKESARNEGVVIDAICVSIEARVGSKSARRPRKEHVVEDPVAISYEKTATGALCLTTIVHKGCPRRMRRKRPSRGLKPLNHVGGSLSQATKRDDSVAGSLFGGYS
ncbi:uncharacterized protein A4U43_C01F23370 [Asparagus officinalis]|uniref:Uncharacterized protein n=1 Tax=Asparagus officinalis TaxID=4686 RepID=A0A5P1FVT9_ASPOF|nr:uncharacterized protein A4U43_C01F23370 [Asparagus officinalis]